MGLSGPNPTVSLGTSVYLVSNVTIITLKDWTIHIKGLWAHTISNYLQWSSTGGPPGEGRSPEKVRASFGNTSDAQRPVMHRPVLHNERTVPLKCEECPQRKLYGLVILENNYLLD